MNSHICIFVIIFFSTLNMYHYIFIKKLIQPNLTSYNSFYSSTELLVTSLSFFYFSQARMHALLQYSQCRYVQCSQQRIKKHMLGGAPSPYFLHLLLLLSFNNKFATGAQKGLHAFGNGRGACLGCPSARSIPECNTQEFESDGLVHSKVAYRNEAYM